MSIEAENTRELSFGEKAAGVGFNPSSINEVDKIKKECADIIDRLNYARDRATSASVKRYLSTAITHIETGQMFAVKAVTWRHD